ncbi:SMI1/KNR4 family protein [Bartonella sp. ML70XJBT.G]|uniref:SMI1/KNR4 family protein n=1 Tax=Bartonella sp. ML70XJBT.G TaxID=3019093 RepID=UPI00235E609B|nr:SMI1/KNR4 family protein [Bartonella sp. ML70XJBT.G]
MQTYTLDDVIELVDKVDKYDSDIVRFGTAENAVDDIWIENAEKALGLQFTSSYKAFLKHYKGGDIAGYEIYSLYKECGEDIPFDDIVLQNLNYYRKHGFEHQNSLPLAEQILVKPFTLIIHSFGMVNAHSMSCFHLKSANITQVIFMNSFVKELKKAWEMRYLMVINQLKNQRSLPLDNLSLFTSVFGKSYGGDNIGNGKSLIFLEILSII